MSDGQVVSPSGEPLTRRCHHLSPKDASHYLDADWLSKKSGQRAINSPSESVKHKSRCRSSGLHYITYIAIPVSDWYILCPIVSDLNTIPQSLYHEYLLFIYILNPKFHYLRYIFYFECPMFPFLHSRYFIPCLLSCVSNTNTLYRIY